MKNTKKVKKVAKKAPASKNDVVLDFPEHVQEDSSTLKPIVDSEEEAEDTDEELRVALREGLIKSDGLNIVHLKKRPIINLVPELKSRLEKMPTLSWLETLDVTTTATAFEETEDANDFEREINFYKQAEKAAAIAVPRLQTMGVRVFRPTDYYAEMAKSDEHMQKVRKRLLETQEIKDRQEAIRAIRKEKKFATKTKNEVVDARQKEKKLFLETIKKHRKGMKQQLDDMLSNAKRLQVDEADDDRRVMNRGGSAAEMDHVKRKMSRNVRDKRFGFGGRKKGMKRNTKQSFDDLFKGKKGKSGPKKNFGRK
ncbi:unnamed protein product, partial [Mesorhabditis belari]|uniref:rRNA-processing protein EBP2 n=1 Tax=Mesorhabditis belari TaxID=2138241 RepID=A0AAF3F4Q0_9BILA